MLKLLLQSQGRCRVLWIQLLLVIACVGFTGLAYSASEATSSAEVSDTLEEHLALALKEKREFEEYIRRQLHDLEDKMQVLKEKSTDLHETTQSKLNENIEILKEQKKEILSKIEDFRNSSENAWKDIRESILNSLNDLEQSLPQSSPSP
ncbi:MAG: hypothetical protein ACPGYT_03280 [Nitrospirales bacterium]